MTKYLTAQVCLNGHMVTSAIEHNPELMQDYCSKCGAKTITNCPNCNAPIRGELYDDEIAIIGFTSTLDSYCVKCGMPYPWTASALESATLMIREDSELSEIERRNLEESLPDILSETPRTKLASIRIKKALLTAGEFTADALRQFVIDFGCELAKKSLGF